jgi:hypothetical protein
MSLYSVCQWLAATPASIALHESHYAYLVILTVHVLSLCLFAGTAAMLDLRLLGVTLRHVRVSEVINRLLPWTLAGGGVTIISGALLFYAAPLRAYENVFFRAKMVTLLLAALSVWVFYKTVFRSVGEWDKRPVPPRGARIAGGLALLLWAILITLGRMIPYQVYWFN